MGSIDDRRRDDPGDGDGRDAFAIIGMSCLFPSAPDVDAYWRNILGSVDAISDPPPGAWDTEAHYRPENPGPGQVYCKRGGYLGALAAFDPLADGIPPVYVGGEPDQWLALRMAREAMADAGYAELDEATRRRTAVVLGKGTYLNGGNSVPVQHGLVVHQTLQVLKALHPEFGEEELREIDAELRKNLPTMTPETVPGLIPNIIVGRIANRLDLMGPTYTVDAACASSLVAVQLAIRDLRDGEADLALVGGAQVWMPLPTLGVFCQLGALSRREQIRPFDKDADGTLLGEGIGMIVLKRLADAERDGDRIYALIRGVGVASDGKGLSVMAPRVEGEELALRRAYEAAGVDPSSVGLIEAHGTGTPVGDATEIKSLGRVFGARDARLPRCAIGTVKSMISHTIPASGVAAIIKTALALHHKVLPPTLNCDEPNPKLGLETSPFYINSSARPWVHGGDEPRRAGINAFGFGGINAHVVLEEHRPSAAVEAGTTIDLTSHLDAWETEVCVLKGETPALLLERARRLESWLDSAPEKAPARLRDVAYTLALELGEPGSTDGLRLAVVAKSVADLRAKLGKATARLADPDCAQIRDVSGIYYASKPLGREGKLAWLVPGEGAQYPNMLADLCVHFPEVRGCFDTVDRIFKGHERDYLPSDYIFPRKNATPEEKKWAEARLWEMDGAIESVLVADQAIMALLKGLGVKPDAIVGHSSGEYAALQAAGIVDLGRDEDKAWFVRELANSQVEAEGESGVARAKLVTIGARREVVDALVREAGVEAHVAMDNCNFQVIVAVGAADVDAILELAKRDGLITGTLEFDRPYHTPLFSAYAEKLRKVVAQFAMAEAEVPLYSCTSIRPFPEDQGEARDLIVDHWVKPVEFRRTIEAMYADGVRLFVEAGPRGNLTAFVEDILRGRPFCAVPANTQRRSGITQINHLAGLLASQGVGLDLRHLHARRSPRPIAWDAPASKAKGRASSLMPLATGFPPIRLGAELAEKLRGGFPTPKAPAATPEPTPAVVAPAVVEPPAPVVAHEPPAPAFVEFAAEAVPEPAYLPEPIFAAEPSLPPAVATAGVSPVAFAAPGATDGDIGASVIRSYLNTMGMFLTVEESLLREMLRPSDRPPGEPPSSASNGPGGLGIPAVLAFEALTGHGFGPMTPREAPAETAAPSRIDPPPPIDPPAARAATSPAAQAESVESILLEVVADRTGYPVEMLEMDLDLEADLGIDSIKRVEILGTLRNRWEAPAGLDFESLTTLRTLRQILEALGSAEGPAAPGGYPLLGEVVQEVPGESLVARRTFDPESDVYLLDHALGRSISNRDPGLVGLILMPMTMSLEILAEGAASVAGGRTIVGLRDVRAHRWIAFGDGPQTLEVSARASGEGRVAVQIRNLTEDARAKDPLKAPVIEATFLIADAYPPAPGPKVKAPVGGAPSTLSADRLYSEVMFHGPRWRGVESMDRVGPDGASATLRVLPFDDYLKGQGAPNFVIDPAVLDAAGQVLGFWTAETLPRGQVVFPFQVDAIDIFGPNRPAGDRVGCRAAIHLFGDQLAFAEIEVARPDGRLWYRLSNWGDKRFDLPASFRPLIRPIGQAGVSESWPAITSGLAGPDRFECRRIETGTIADRGFWKQVWSQRVLSRAERSAFAALKSPEPRQIDWLAGRTAAKEAVIELLRRQGGSILQPSDIEIRPDAWGRPLVFGAQVRAGSMAPVVSISHAEGVAVAVAGLAPEGSEEPVRIGIDVEAVRPRPEGFAEVAFSEPERRLLKAFPREVLDEWQARFWSAKEAVAKAFGEGLLDGPKTASVASADARSGLILVRLAGQLAQAHPELEGVLFEVETRREGGLVSAFTLCKPSGLATSPSRSARPITA